MENMSYIKSHEWIKRIDEKTVEIGISEFAQSELGDLVFVNLPEVGDTITMGEPFADVESVKAVSDIIAPVTGVVTEINEDLLTEPELINQDAPNAWFVRVSDITEEETYLTLEEYQQFVEQEQ